MTPPAARPRTSRRHLFATTESRSIGNRADLVSLARTGYAGVRLSGHHVMPSMSDRDLVSLVALLRDARGVGLRVLWSGECGDLDVRCLQHLDPPRRPDGTFVWSPRADAQLLARRGPTVISVDDTRLGPRRRILIDRSTPEAQVLEAADWEREITTTERAGMRSLARDGLAFSSGDYCVGLPVRQGIWCV
ncbi:DUF5825 family protein [Streptomyces tropicalis]|uniref:DUF5825 family protein n=1 Tax=Streptomyces tropicalis TaxID=3034234 RepID=A0ABT6A166_9ACTN|nr:DUF5825 family protein [Streptomyces tropicalis]MDF3298389.1 DUF5825 family protein [Streptomyces tropicalis]